jgi:hypothetical protein
LGRKFGASKPFQKEVVDWVSTSGGNLIVNGERISHAAGDWPKWFGLEWVSSDYYRTTHVRNPDHWAMEWFQTAANKKAPLEMNVKSYMITNVAPQDILFGTAKDSVSYSLVPGFGGKPISAGQAVRNSALGSERRTY